MRKQFIRAVAFLVALSWSHAPSAQDTKSTEAILLVGTGIWSGGIDSSRPGCTNANGCIKGAMTFQFFKLNGELRLRIAFTPGDNAYNAAVARKSYAGSPDMASDGRDAWRKPNLAPGNKVVFSDNWRYDCTITPQEADCGRVALAWNVSDPRSHDGWVFKFKLNPWPPR